MRLKHLLQISAIACTIVILQSCEQQPLPGVYQDGKIATGLRDKLHKLNDQLFAIVKDNKVRDIEDMMTKDMMASPDYKHTVEMISNESKIGKYDLLAEYYINNVREDHNNDITSADKTYQVGYHSSTHECYIAFMTVQHADDKWMITAVYGKYDYGWKLTDLFFDRYAIDGLSAMQLYKLAQHDHDKHYYADAANNASLAFTCLRPSPIWKYNKEDRVGVLLSLANTEANEHYKFPVAIADLPSQPKIFRIVTQSRVEGGVYPMIYYLTKTDIKDTVAVKKEFEGIKKSIGKAIPGIDKDKKYILFEAYNQLPRGANYTPSFSMEYKLE